MILRGADLGPVFEAFSVGYQAGKRSQPLFGTRWEQLWGVPLGELRTRLDVDPRAIVGEGIRAAA